jgi:hypothetical protein
MRPVFRPRARCGIQASAGPSGDGCTSFSSTAPWRALRAARTNNTTPAKAPTTIPAIAPAESGAAALGHVPSSGHGDQVVGIQHRHVRAPPHVELESLEGGWDRFAAGERLVVPLKSHSDAVRDGPAHGERRQPIGAVGGVLSVVFAASGGGQAHVGLEAACGGIPHVEAEQRLDSSRAAFVKLVGALMLLSPPSPSYWNHDQLARGTVSWARCVSTVTDRIPGPGTSPDRALALAHAASAEPRGVAHDGRIAAVGRAGVGPSRPQNHVLVRVVNAVQRDR